jgi:hypothetical protein
MQTDRSFIPSLSKRRTRATGLWSREDLSRLRELAHNGASLHFISMTLRRTESAIKNKAGMHGISLQATNRAASR